MLCVAFQGGWVYNTFMKKVLIVLCLMVSPAFAKSKPNCEALLFHELDTNYNNVVELDEFNRLYQIVFDKDKKSCQQVLKIIQKQKAPDPILGKVNTAPLPNLPTPQKFPSEPNMPPPSKLAPSMYIE